ncbi:MAG: hypothetical protein LBH74_03195 [Nitrososphaerota archaeon]|uniref:hypothetical protein n=1 Tax=Candidatus Bathycorpusculum sp. TaxID=2994959 RepID=UPI00282D4BEF|nr:hypothetical protein [Candidatus Termitimicrobium sp.]MCL2431112.1 hypothetical protein [Candidatus Termitimicrobium sp.]MDR0492631.1 hypothetical protein [Nitrososphaerota archaeon]
MTLGFYDNFPPNVHHAENYRVIVTNRQLQQHLIQFFDELNHRRFNFEEVTIPTIPNGVVIFEFGLAETDSFTFLNETQTKKALEYVSRVQVQTLDFFCVIRYYKNSYGKQQALKFDYYMLRMVFKKGTFELQIYHERGPRYLSPQDIEGFLVNNLNISAKRGILQKSAPTN